MTLPTHDRATTAFGGGGRAPLPRAISLLLLFAAPLLFTLSASAQPATKKVLFLTGSDPNHPGFSILTQRIRATIRDGSADRVEFIYEIQEGLIRPPASPRDDEELVSYLKKKYEGKRIDMILSAAAPRFRLFLKNDPGLFAGVPKVFYDFEEEREATYRDAGPNVTGVWARVDYSRTLDVALSLHPDTRRVVVVVDNSPEGTLLGTKARAEFRKYEGRVEFEYLTDVTVAELKDRLAALPRDTIVYYLFFYMDRAGNRYPGPEALTRVAPTSGAPIYGHAETALGYGLVGGSLLDFDAIGRRLGEVSLRILHGERPEEITSQTVPNVMTFDWRELKRWGISEEKLPPGSVVKFKEFSFWELYKWYIVAAVAACVIEALLIAYLLLVQRRRRRAERERERLAAQVEAEHRHLDETVSNVPGIVWESQIDPKTETRRTTFISDYVEKMLGYTSEEWLSAPPGFGFRITPEEDRERAVQASEEATKSGKEVVYQHRWLAKDGRVLWVETHMSPMFDEAGKVVGLRGVSIDITEKRLAEEARRRSEERNLATLRAIPDLMFLQTRDGVYLEYYARDVKDLFVLPEQFIGKSVRDVMPPELAEMFLERFALVDESGDPQVVEYDLNIDGWQRWYEARMVRSGEDILSVVRDITERKQAEAELSFQARMLNTVEQAAIATDMSGVVFYWNRFAEKLYGWSAEEVMGRPIKDFLNYENSRELSEEVWAQLKAGRGWAGEFTLRRRDGAVLQIWANDSLIYNDSGVPVGVLGISHDITERKRAEEALRDSEEKYRTLFKSIDEGFCVFELIYDGEGRAVDGLFAVTNPAFERQTGLKDATGRRIGELIPHLEFFWLDKYESVAATGKPERFTAQAAPLNRWFDVYTFRVGEEGSRTVAVIFSDVTERIRAVEQIRRSEAVLKQAGRMANLGAWEVDLTHADEINENPLTWSDQVYRIYGYEPGSVEVTSALFFRHVHPDDRQRIDREIRATVDEGKPYEQEHRIVRADGAVRVVQEYAVIDLDEAGRPCRILGAVQDITERKLAEEALHTALEEVSRLTKQLQEENVYLREEIKLEHNFSEIVGGSDAIKYVLHKIEQVAPTGSTVLITGETGTGKELVARAIHGESPRRERPLVKVNCAALSPTLIESELFGHERGAFTGAVGRKAGRFELADGATIFLDEIGELPPELQAKLLRVIQEGEFERLGGTRTIKADVRIVAATNRDLWKEVQAGTFREDLFYRLNVFPITMPPLRQRAEDIPLLVEHFVASFSRKMGKKITSVTPSTLNALRTYPWPGNVRELANVIERAVINNGGPVLQISNLAEALSAETPSAPSKTLEEMEREYIITVLDGTGWRIEGRHGAARILGLHPSTLRTRMAKLKVQKQQMSPT